MSLWIKICGNTSLGDALAAAQAGADALGFVFAGSPRQLSVSAAAAIVRRLPDSVEKIGVFVEQSPEEIYMIVRSCCLTGVQLHSEMRPDLPARLHERLGPKLRILRVVHFGPDAAQQAEALSQDHDIDAVLIDSRTSTAVGGTGIAFDWQLARKTIFQNARQRKLIAAGGLNPDNVAEAVAKLRPWGIDVASGVESAPGVKDLEKVQAFIANARPAKQP